MNPTMGPGKGARHRESALSVSLPAEKGAGGTQQQARGLRISREAALSIRCREATQGAQKSEVNQGNSSSTSKGADLAASYRVPGSEPRAEGGPGFPTSHKEEVYKAQGGS